MRPGAANSAERRGKQPSEGTDTVWSTRTFERLLISW